MASSSMIFKPRLPTLKKKHGNPSATPIAFTEGAQLNQAVQDLIEIIHFTESVSAKISGLRDEDEIFATLTREFGESDLCALTLWRLTDDGSKLRLVGTSLNLPNLEKAEKLLGVSLENFKIDLASSEFFSQVVKEGRTLQVNIQEMLKGVLPGPMISVVSGLLDLGNRRMIYTPLERGHKVIGALSLSSTDLAEHFIPSVKNLACHVSNALSLAKEKSKSRRTKMALGESQELFSNIVESLEDGILVLDRDYNCTYWNGAMEKISGIPREQVMGSGKAVWEILPHLAEQGIDEKIRKAMGGEVVRQENIPYNYENGRVGFTSVIFLPLRSRGGEIHGVVGVISEVTERKRTREGLKASEEKYRLLVENANEAIVVAQDGVLKFANPKASEITGFTQKELVSKSFVDLIHPDDVQMVVERYRRRLKGEEAPNIYTFRVIDRDRCTRWVEINAVSFDWEGRPATLNFITDVTARKDVEKALMESEEKWRSWVENAPERITTLDQDGTILFVNRVSPGFSVQEMIGNSIYNYLPVDEEHKVRKALEEVFQSGRPSRYEGTFVGADGTKINLENSIGPVKRGGKIVAAILISVDVSDRKHAEEALRRHEERMHTLFEVMAEGVIVLDSEGYIVEANPAAETILGIKRSELGSNERVTPEWEAIRPDGSKMPSEEVPQTVAMREKRPVRDVVVGIKRFDGTISWLSVSAVPFSKMAGEETGVVATFADITKWKRMEGEVRRNSEYLEKIFAASPDGIAVTDEMGTIVECNQAILDLHGFTSKDQILGKSVFGLVPEEDHERVRFGLRQTIEEGSVRNMPLIVMDKSGRKIPVELSGNIVKDPAGGPLQFVAVIHKIESDGKKLDRERFQEQEVPREDGGQAAVGA